MKFMLKKSKSKKNLTLDEDSRDDKLTHFNVDCFSYMSVKILTHQQGSNNNYEFYRDLVKTTQV